MTDNSFLHRHGHGRLHVVLCAARLVMPDDAGGRNFYWLCLRSGHRTCGSVPGLTTASKSSKRRDEPIDAASFSLWSMGLSKVPMTYSIGHSRVRKWEILQKPSGSTAS